MGKKRTFSPGSDEPQNCPRLKQTRLENFLLPSPHPSTAEAALVDTPPPPPYSQTTTPEPHVSPTSPSGPYQQQPSVSTSASYQPSDSDNLILQHSLFCFLNDQLGFFLLRKSSEPFERTLKGASICTFSTLPKGCIASPGPQEPTQTTPICSCQPSSPLGTPQ